MSTFRVGLVACPSCACHHRADAAECPHSGASHGTSPRSRAASAVLLGLTLATGTAVSACGDDTGSGGQGGAASTTTSTGTTATKSTSTGTTQQSTMQATTNNVSSAYGTGPTSTGSDGVGGGI
jgi:hypothetical protein